LCNEIAVQQVEEVQQFIRKFRIEIVYAKEHHKYLEQIE
jgi:hypothetical protein